MHTRMRLAAVQDAHSASETERKAGAAEAKHKAEAESKLEAEEEETRRRTKESGAKKSETVRATWAREMHKTTTALTKLQWQKREVKQSSPAQAVRRRASNATDFITVSAPLWSVSKEENSRERNENLGIY